MGIYGALSTAIAGLQAQSYALTNISGNIANSQTTGFKRTETNFVDLVGEAVPEQQTAGAVLASSRSTNNVQGDIQSADIGTYMAINGTGMFVVSESIGEADGNPLFNSTNFYTRRGDFQMDRFGYLVNGSGYYLQSLDIDPTTGNLAGSSPSPLRISNDRLPASATTEVEYRANLARYPLTANADPNTADSELFDDAVTIYANDPTAAGDGFVQADDVTNFIERTIAGGAVTIYDASGGAMNVQIRWAKTDTALTGGTDTWEAFYLEDNTATGTDPAWRNLGTTFSFGTDGQQIPTPPAVSITTELTRDFTVNGLSVTGVTMRFGNTGLTQYADNNGSVEISNLEQNGYSSGDLVGVSISDVGRIRASYTNGRTQDVAAIAVAQFNAPNLLQKRDGGAFTVTSESGEPIIGASNQINGGAVEASNVDVADEFTKLIVTQQAYAASTRVVSTSDEMIQEALNMIR